ncbi:FAD-binding dehydrogenase [Amycolatopsis acidiphila]|uniref:FAD-binding dehydrogenase n=1 Tax=Amycolatopsis acidiphila TaxID=715473 RepID=A0A558AE29_9PSEU|nr:FAD-binding dehydrogenase [Amycolatopsis acidiphila]TVT22520.1 FAD-binding dehydrogenase [Amycolatopsis acidiphila]UIJ58844.1 FAD-binding dehydrogenase [Amycolatopsis acidiphila]GHG72321.1 FAD-binding dehydrogenase [Amycolatopsis acidiphila]
MDADVIVVGAGLAGLVAASELTAAGKRVLVVEQEPEASLGGQAFWSFGGLFLVNTPEQRRLGIRDSVELAWRDWETNAAFDRPEDHWPRKWARAYVEFAAGEKRSWLRSLGLRFFPIVNWAERGGNTVPRFHLTWGTGPAVVEPFARRARDTAEFRFRHRVDALTTTAGVIDGVSGTILEPSPASRGRASSRVPVGEFCLKAQAVLVCSGGIGGNHDLVRQNWPERLGPPPHTMLTGVPSHVDGRMLGISEAAGGHLIGRDRMWHYVEGVTDHTPVWPGHGIRILPGPSPLWLDALGRRLPAPLYPGFDTLGTLAHLRTTGHDHSWFVLTTKTIAREFALSGSEQNPDLTGKSVLRTLGRAFGIPGPVKAFLAHGADFVQAREPDELVRRMNALTGEPLLDPAAVRGEVLAHDEAVAQWISTRDLQVNAVRVARRYLGDRLVRVAPPHRLLDPKAGPLIAVRLSVLSRKTLGGLETDLSGQVLRAGGAALPGLYAAGEAAGFGGGGLHGYRALEGGFLGGCLFSGRQAGRAIAASL